MLSLPVGVALRIAMPLMCWRSASSGVLLKKSEWIPAPWSGLATLIRLLIELLES